MSWGVVKKAINNDLNEPLNYLMWVDDLILFGELGYAYNDVGILKELATKSKQVLKNNISYNRILDETLVKNEYVGDFIFNLFGEPEFSNLSTLTDIANNSDAVMRIIENTKVQDFMINEPIIIEVLLNTSNSRNLLLNDTIIFDKIISSKFTSDILFSIESATADVINDTAKFDIAFSKINAVDSIILNYSVVLPLIFANIGIMEKVWDNASSCEKLLANAQCRLWLRNNVAQVRGLGDMGTSWTVQTTKKSIILGAVTSYNGGGGYSVRYIKPTNATEAFGSGTSFRDIFKRTQGLEVYHDSSGSAFTLTFYYVIMQA